MNENENKTAETKQCSCKSDLRTFFIALLTSVIVLAIYHFGTGLCAILSGTSGYGCMPVTREFVLVPVASMPPGCPAMCPRGQLRGPGEFRKGHLGKMHGKFRRRGEMKPFCKPECPAPEKAPDPDKAPASASK